MQLKEIMHALYFSKSLPRHCKSVVINTHLNQIKSNKSEFTLIDRGSGPGNNYRVTLKRTCNFIELCKRKVDLHLLTMNLLSRNWH